MRRLPLVLLALLTLSRPVGAQDAKPNSLTAKEIADGWILLFDGETTFGWKTHGPVQARNGELLLGGETSAAIETTTRFGDGVLTMGLKHAKNVLVEIDLAEQQVKWPVVGNADKWTDCWFAIKQGKIVSVNSVKLGQANIDPGQINRLKPASVRVQAHSIGSRTFSPVAIRNISFRPDITESLFNGKDLAGWKIFPGKKSEFAVIDGAINIKDGPGDLQTEKQFGDFLLQFECISHGKHLNSGVFFRCRPNEYQNGYEAQVRNQFTEKPTQKYLLEEYDPETHKLLGKKEAMFTAVDFGTGAIYRRQPARKEMSKDGEWFTMTVAAHGNHIATWVNGVQVTDWFDHRPRSDNARTGCRLEPGHISLQGHDPTTNLSFRNFRIQEYPEVKP